MKSKEGMKKMWYERPEVRKRYGLDDPVNQYFHTRASLWRWQKIEAQRPLEPWEQRCKEVVERDLERLSQIEAVRQFYHLDK